MTPDPKKQLANAFKAMVILVAFFAAIAFFTSCSKTEVIEKNIIQTVDNPADSIMIEYQLPFSRWHRMWRYHANMSSPKDSLFYYTVFPADPDSPMVEKRWYKVMSHEVAAGDYKVVISRKAPTNGQTPE